MSNFQDIYQSLAKNINKSKKVKRLIYRSAPKELVLSFCTLSEDQQKEILSIVEEIPKRTDAFGTIVIDENDFTKEKLNLHIFTTERSQISCAQWPSTVRRIVLIRFFFSFSIQKHTKYLRQ